jgi:hypothetical protein
MVIELRPNFDMLKGMKSPIKILTDYGSLPDHQLTIHLGVSNQLMQECINKCKDANKRVSNTKDDENLQKKVRILRRVDPN